ncbi:MAG TPA: DinB family protein [Anaerolineales bacterium]|nr:DinB family protein [Anaerolineales bacterium]
MLIRVGIENNNDGRSIAWSLEHPGCFAYGRDADEAESSMQQAASDYAAWVQRHGMSWMQSHELEISVEETFDAYFIPRPGALAPDQTKEMMVESFFRYDEEPLTSTDIERAHKLLDWSRQDLLDVIRGLDPEKRNATYSGERWSINGILKHIGGAEWWYQERIGSPFPEREQDLPSEPLERLELVRAHFVSLLPGLEAVRHTVERDGELWSPRKVLRRAVWHERDHTEHIRKLL